MKCPFVISWTSRWMPRRHLHNSSVPFSPWAIAISRSRFFFLIQWLVYLRVQVPCFGRLTPDSFATVEASAVCGSRSAILKRVSSFRYLRRASACRTSKATPRATSWPRWQSFQISRISLSFWTFLRTMIVLVQTFSSATFAIYHTSHQAHLENIGLPDFAFPWSALLLALSYCRPLALSSRSSASSLADSAPKLGRGRPDTSLSGFAARLPWWGRTSWYGFSRSCLRLEWPRAAWNQSMDPDRSPSWRFLRFGLHFRACWIRLRAVMILCLGQISVGVNFQRWTCWFYVQFLLLQPLSRHGLIHIPKQWVTID